MPVSCEYCYNIEIGHPVFDRIELPYTINEYHNCYIVDTCKMQWFLYFLHYIYVQAAQPVPSTKVQ